VPLLVPPLDEPLLDGLAPPEALPDEVLEEPVEDEEEPVEDEDELPGVEVVVVEIVVPVFGVAAATVEVGTVSVETPPVSAPVGPPPPHALSSAPALSAVARMLSRRRSIVREGVKKGGDPSACRSVGSR
jgi:hypothetical protein